MIIIIIVVLGLPLDEVEVVGEGFLVGQHLVQLQHLLI